MSVEVIGMYGAIAGGTENAIANIDIPMSGFIVGIDWDVSVLLDATGEVVNVELSFIGTGQFSTNDVRGRISSVSARAVILTAVGINSLDIQKWLGSFDISVAGGERLYLHANSTAGVTGSARCNLYFDSGTVQRRSARRR